MQRFLIVSDTHGVLDSRIAGAVRPGDIVLHAGDVGAAGVLKALGQARALYAVAGNNDTPAKWPAAEADVLARLPEACEIEGPGGTIALIHGHQYPDARSRHRRLRARFPDARCIVYGHSHHMCIDDIETPWVVNPGAGGRVRTYGGPSYQVLEAGPGRWRIGSVRVSACGRQKA